MLLMQVAYCVNLLRKALDYTHSSMLIFKGVSPQIIPTDHELICHILPSVMELANFDLSLQCELRHVNSY